jgi:hypothetical protein
MEPYNNDYIRGDLFMILESLKIVNKDFHIDKENDPESNSDKILLYESLIFNHDREDSLFYQDNVNNLITKDKIIEHFSSDKNDLFLKLIKLYQNKFKKLGIQKSLPALITLNFTPTTSYRKDSFVKKSSKITGFNNKIYANLLLVYRDGRSN